MLRWNARWAAPVSLVALVSLMACGDDFGGSESYEPGPAADVGEAGEGCTTEPCAGDPIPAGQLTAGEWRDLDDWELWTDLVGEGGTLEEAHLRWGMDTRQRFPVRVEEAGTPVVDARVALVDATGRTEWETHTDVNGEAELFAGVEEAASGPFTVIATSGEGRVERTIEASAERVVLELAGAAVPRRALDLMFVIDTTGSMGDELRYIQAELGDVVQRARAAASQSFDLRIAMSFYRDRGDDYVVRSNAFTPVVDEALSQLAAESANGGGDWPEAVDQALEDAIIDHDWSEDATARLLFLVLDAPPHEEQQTLERMHMATRAAAAEGVQVVAVSGSGIQQSTEVLLRSLGILTGGTYVFLTDHSGIGGDHIEPTVGAYQVEYLNDLMARLIVESVDGR